jgi:hypothetical protein
MTTDVFVVGLDPSNAETLTRVPHAEDYRFHPLLTREECHLGEVPVAALLAKAEHQLDEFDGEIGAIVGFWDFPVTTMVPLLCRRYGLPSADLQAVVKCEHKFWSRVEQSEVIDEHPNFGLVDLRGDARPPEGVRYPMWLKPVKSFSSELAFQVADDEEFAHAVDRIREGVGRIGRPFQFILDKVDPPPEIAAVGGQACLAEEALSGVQAATEGYVHHGNVTVYGVLDSIDYPDSPCFLRHQYPSQLPAGVVDRMKDVSVRVIEHMGLVDSMFSIEFFCRPETGEVWVLEINPRHSQSHAHMFEDVDGAPNHHAMLQLGLGRDPRMPHREGPYSLSAKWYHRRFSDARVTRLPSPEEIDQLRREISRLTVEPVPQLGQLLSELPGQDSYSYELAHVFIGARDEPELEWKYQRCIDRLHFEFAEEG